MSEMPKPPGAGYTSNPPVPTKCVPAPPTAIPSLYTGPVTTFSPKQSALTTHVVAECAREIWCFAFDARPFYIFGTSLWVNSGYQDSIPKGQ